VSGWASQSIRGSLTGPAAHQPIDGFTVIPHSNLSGPATVRPKRILWDCPEPRNIVQYFTERVFPQRLIPMPESEQSIGRKILGFFIKEEEAGTTATGTPASPPPPGGAPAPAVPRPPVSATTPNPAPVNAAAGTIDPKFAQHFADVLAQHNAPGPDYFEFRETLRGLANLGLTEEKQYQAAWASFKALAGTADLSMLTNTANQYVTALSKDREAFGKSVEAAIAERVGGLQNEQKRLQTENESLAKQLLAIQQQIDTNNNRLTAIGGEVTEQSARITQNQQNYEVTFAHFTDQIKGDIAKITQYLK
jgi:hypothetical protein